MICNKSIIQVALLLNCFTCTKLYSQDKLIGLNNTIKVAPLRTIDISNPGLEMAFEKRVFKIFSLQAGASYLTETLSRLDIVNPNIINSNGYAYNAELKTYFKSGKYGTWYTSASFAKLKNEVEWVGTFGKSICYHNYEPCSYIRLCFIKKKLENVRSEIWIPDLHNPMCF